MMDLYIGKPTFQRKLRANDILMDSENINEDAIYLGHKKLLPKAAMEDLVKLEGKARTYLTNRSIEFPLSGARFVSYPALPAVLKRLKELQELYNAAVRRLVENYTMLRDQQLSVLDKQCENLHLAKVSTMSEQQRKETATEMAEWLVKQRQTNRSLYPPVEALPKMFAFTWRMFKISALQGMEEMSTLAQDELLQSQEQMKAEIKSWAQQAVKDMHLALGQAAKQAREMFEKQDKLNPKNLKPLFEAFETFSAIDFTGSSDWREQVENARERFIQRDVSGNIDFEKTASSINGTKFAGDEFKKLLESIGSLAVEQTAQAAGLKAMSKVGEFRRLIEV